MDHKFTYPKNIKFAHIGSLGTYRILSSLADFDMFLASLLMRDCRYAEFCKERSLKRYTILDTGALELIVGTEWIDVSSEHLIDMALSLGVREVVCPDMPDDPKVSFQKSQEFIRRWFTKCSEARIRLMVVPHGRNLQEWFTNANKLISLIDKCTVGIPRLLANSCSSNDPGFRIRVARKLKEAYPHISIHLLGAGRQFCRELCYLREAYYIRSLDSTFIHRYAFSESDPLKEYTPPMTLSETNVPFSFNRRAMDLKKCIDKKICRIIE